jgi:hypothetical protein
MFEINSSHGARDKFPTALAASGSRKTDRFGAVAGRVRIRREEFPKFRPKVAPKSRTTLELHSWGARETIAGRWRALFPNHDAAGRGQFFQRLPGQEPDCARQFVDGFSRRGFIGDRRFDFLDLLSLRKSTLCSLLRQLNFWTHCD